MMKKFNLEKLKTDRKAQVTLGIIAAIIVLFIVYRTLSGGKSGGNGKSGKQGRRRG